MSFAHEKLDVYRTATKYNGWAYRLCEGMKVHQMSPTVYPSGNGSSGSTT